MGAASMTASTTANSSAVHILGQMQAWKVTVSGGPPNTLRSLEHATQGMSTALAEAPPVASWVASMLQKAPCKASGTANYQLGGY